MIDRDLLNPSQINQNHFPNSRNLFSEPQSLLNLQSPKSNSNSSYFQSDDIRTSQNSRNKRLKNLSSAKAIRQNTFGIPQLDDVQQNDKSNPYQKQNTGRIASKRPFTVIEPRKMHVFNQFSDDRDDTFMQVFKSSPNNMLKNENEDDLQINIRTFNSKFIRELNFKENERFRKNRKKVQINFNKENVDTISSKRKKPVKPFNRKQMHQIWHNGIKVISEFKNDILHGQTQVYYPNGAKFIGKYEQGVRIFGSFDFNNGYIYWGGFLGDKFNGEGELTLPNKKVYSGDWVQSQLVGKVQIKYPSGDVYYGQVNQFKKHGKGYLFFKNGQKFVGDFKDGSITGKGEYFINQECIGRGFWKNGQLIQRIQNDDQFSMFDAKSVGTPSNANLADLKSYGKIQKKSINEQEDDIQMDDVDEQTFHIEIRSNKFMLSFREFQLTSDKKSEDCDSYQNDISNKQQKKSNISKIQEQQHDYTEDSTKNKRKKTDKSLKKQIQQNRNGNRKLKDKSKEKSSNRKIKRQKSKKKTSTISFSNDVQHDSEKKFISTNNSYQQVEITDLCRELNNPNSIEVQNPMRQNYRGSQASGSQNSQNSESCIKFTGKFHSIGSIINTSQKGSSDLKQHH